ncbi:MAG TPA: hypothetical protein VFV72_17135 [Candidatus Limnocylindrales bacterium]|nr:hypothetical protein [Candidatus Limnocylindrales bacterium]
MTTTDQPILGTPAERAATSFPGTATRSRAHAAPTVTVGGLLRGIHPILFAIYPIFFLWSQNVGEVAPPDVTDVLGATFLAALAVTGIAWLLFVDRARGALVATPAILGFLLYGHVANLKIPPQVEQGAWMALMAGALVLALKLPTRWIDRLDRGLRILAIALIAIALVGIVPTEVEEATTPRTIIAAGKTLPNTTTAPRRDVYWLVFDRYGSNESFEVGYGVGNDLNAWLEDQGFEVLAGSHANYVGTALSLSTTLNMTPLDQLTRGVPKTSNSYQPVYNMLQGSLVTRQFQALGYRYLHLGSWWNPTRTDASADRNYNADGVSDFASAMVEESLVPVLSEAFLPEELPPTEPAKHLKHNAWALNKLDSLPHEGGPKFVFAHILLPHPPYVFDKDGTYIESPQRAGITEVEGWRGQLEYTNSRIRSFVSELLAKPESEQPIIIIQADEGPWPEKYGADKYHFDWSKATDREIEMKFGIMNAWYVPGGTDALGLRQDQTAINTFPTLFDKYFGLDYPALPDRSFASSWGRPYASIEITDRLEELEKDR